jgi:L,D-transpeptidase catalytic domain
VSACTPSGDEAGLPCPDAADEDAAPSCVDPIPVYRNGLVAGRICEADAAARGLTIVDLSDDWAPRVMQGGGDLGPVPYRERYLRLARGDYGDDDTWYRARHDRFLELYGISPTFTVVATRLADEQRHACHAAVERTGLTALERGVDTWRPMDKQRGDHAWRQSLGEQLTDAAARLELDGIELLDGHPQLGALYTQYRELSIRLEAIAEAQAHFRCDGLLSAEEGRPGFVDGATVGALQAYLRRHMIVSWQIDEEAKSLMLGDSREHDFLQLLRVLRERVVDATGLIEDGSAAGVVGTVVGKRIDTGAFVDERAPEPLEGAAPDRVAAATDAAARAMGWQTADDALVFFAGDVPPRAALELPAAPSYHREHTELRLVIDRGDVWYDFPFVPNGDRKVQARERMPATILYAKDGDGWIPLVRWPTTVGGWQPERLGNGQVKLVYKESPPGPRIVRDVVAAPRWIPPASTPNRDLVRPRLHGRWSLKYDTIGPSYASAYGLTMLIHHRVDRFPDGTTQLTDQGIRLHGSVSYDSILDGFSHGCHRLHNHRAVRLAGFLIGHRRHEVKGEIPLDFDRSFVWRGKRYDMHFDSRGFRYELDPPLEVEVLEGDVQGWAKRPLLPRSLTRPMLKRYR